MIAVAPPQASRVRDMQVRKSRLAPLSECWSFPPGSAMAKALGGEGR